MAGALFFIVFHFTFNTLLVFFPLVLSYRYIVKQKLLFLAGFSKKRIISTENIQAFPSLFYNDLIKTI